MESLNPVVITRCMTIISGLRRPLTISMVSMSTMKTVFIDIGLSIISTISWFSRSLAISVMAMESLNSVVIARCMAIISWFSGPLAIAIATIAIVTMKPFHTTIYITGSMAIARLSL